MALLPPRAPELFAPLILPLISSPLAARASRVSEVYSRSRGYKRLRDDIPQKVLMCQESDKR